MMQLSLEPGLLLQSSPVWQPLASRRVRRLRVVDDRIVKLPALLPFQLPPDMLSFLATMPIVLLRPIHNQVAQGAPNGVAPLVWRRWVKARPHQSLFNSRRKCPSAAHSLRRRRTRLAFLIKCSQRRSALDSRRWQHMYKLWTLMHQYFEHQTTGAFSFAQ